MRRTAFLILPLLLALALAGCGEEEKKEPLKIGESTAAPDPTDEPSASASAAPFDDEGNDAVRGTVNASGPDEEAVVDAWFAYWDARTQSFFDAKVDPNLGSVAAASAVSDVVRYVAYLKKEKLHTVGDSRFDVTDVAVSRNTATLKSCAENRSIDREADGSPAELPVPFFTAEGALVKAGGSWRVVSLEIDEVPRCAE